ncbi:rho guanine nucleotide exchange factor 19-like [Discoglossus pictus]
MTSQCDDRHCATCPHFSSFFERMEMFCRKRSYSNSPPSVEVTVKRCASCPEYSKPPVVKIRHKRVLTNFFRAKKSNKKLVGTKWSSFDDISLRVLDSQHRGGLAQIDENDLTGCKVFSNPLYQPPVSKITPNIDTGTTQSPTITFTPITLSLRLLDIQEQGKEVAPVHVHPKSLHEKTDTVQPSVAGRLHGNQTNWKRKESKFVHTQPLYQDYWVLYTTGDPGVAMSNFSLDASLSLAGLISSSLIGGSSSPVCNRNYSSSLWQELSEVKSRRILERIGPQQRQLQEAIFEVVTSEASYQRSLSVAVNHFLKSRKLSDCLVITDKHTLFSNLPAVKEVSERFLLDLEDRLEKDIFLCDIGDLVLQHCPAFHRVYIPYVTNQMYQEKLMQQLVRENLKFLQVLRKLEEQPVCKRQLLKSFLVLPFQRITRLKILLENILKLAHGNLVLEHSINGAIVAVGKIVVACNEGVKSMMQTEELVLLEKQVAFQNTKSFPLISQSRVLVQHGELMQILYQEVVVSQRLRLTNKPIYLHLFSDLLLLSRRTDDGRFLVVDYARVGHVKADHIKAKALGLPNQAFLLRLLQNHAGVSCEIILEASSATVKQQWMSLITSQLSHRPSSRIGGEAAAPMTM